VLLLVTNPLFGQSYGKKAQQKVTTIFEKIQAGIFHFTVKQVYKNLQAGEKEKKLLDEIPLLAKEVKNLSFYLNRLSQKTFALFTFLAVTISVSLLCFMFWLLWKTRSIQRKIAFQKERYSETHEKTEALLRRTQAQNEKIIQKEKQHSLQNKSKYKSMTDEIKELENVFSAHQQQLENYKKRNWV
jgi:hypothetical protein